MTTTPIRTMLKEEIKNAGQAMPEDFLDLVKDITHSDSLSMTLVEGVQRSVVGWPGVQMSIVKMIHLQDRTGKMHQIIDDNVHAFSLPLWMLYYGIKIGKQLGAEESKGMQWLNSLDLSIDPNEPEKSKE